MTTDTIELLREMIAIPSVNPMRANSGEAVERGMADFIATRLARSGIDRFASKVGNRAPKARNTKARGKRGAKRNASPLV